MSVRQFRQNRDSHSFRTVDLIASSTLVQLMVRLLEARPDPYLRPVPYHHCTDRSRACLWPLMR